MARIRFQGLDEYELKLSKLQKSSSGIIKRAIYDGASIMIGEIKESISNLPVVNGYGTSENPLRGGVTMPQKIGLMDGIGISPMREENGFFNVKIGFDGYNQTVTEQYPNGQPNTLVARGVESGTSWKKKRPFVRPAIRKARPLVWQRMKIVLDNGIKQIMD